MKRKRILLIVFSTVFSILNFSGCKAKTNHSVFDTRIAPYSKSGTIKKEIDVTSSCVVINNSCSNITIAKSNSKKIVIESDIVVGGKDGEQVKNALNAINYEVKDDGESVVLSSLFNNVLNNNVNSLHIKTNVRIPDNIKSIVIRSDNGNINLSDVFDKVDINVTTGDLIFEGEAKEFKLSANTSSASLKLKKLYRDYNFDLGINTGKLNIMVPKDSKINLRNSNSDDIKIADKIAISNEGTSFVVNSNIARVYFEAY